MRIALLLTLCLCLTPGNISAQKYLSERAFHGQLVKDEITRAYITPVKIVGQSDIQNHHVKNAEMLLNTFNGQLTTSGKEMCVLHSDEDVQASVLLDFGKELYGGIEIAAAIRPDKRPLNVRILLLRESVTEAMSNTGDNSVPGINSATNDHSLRD